MTEVIKQREIIEVGKEYQLHSGEVVEALVLLPEGVIVRYAGCYKKYPFHKDRFLDAVCIDEYKDIKRKEYFIEIPPVHEEPEPQQPQDTSWELD